MERHIQYMMRRLKEEEEKEKSMAGERLDIDPETGQVTGIHPSPNINEILNEQRDTALKESLTQSKRMI